MTSSLEPHTGKDGITTYRIRWWVPGVPKRQSFTDRDRRLVVSMKAQIEVLDHHILATDERITSRSLVNGGVAVANAVRTFEAACRDMINMCAASEIVKRRYEVQLEMHLTTIAETPIDMIEPIDLVGMMRDLANVPRLYRGGRCEPLAKSTLSGLWGVVTATFASEASAGRVRRNPCPAARRALTGVMRRERRHTDKFLTHEEWAYLEPFFAHDPFLTMYLDTLVHSGARWGEAAALRVGDLRLGDATAITISKAVHRDYNGRPLGVHQPKAGSGRTVAISPELAMRLQAWTKGRPAGALVFPNLAGDYILYSNFYAYRWKPAVKVIREAGFTKPLTIHMLRHTAGSWLLHATGDLQLVSKWLGHATISTTADIYMHMMPRGDDRTRAALSGIERETESYRQEPWIKAVGD